MVQQMVQQILLFSRSSPGSLVIHRSLLVKSTSELESTIKNDSDGGKQWKKSPKLRSSTPKNRRSGVSLQAATMFVRHRRIVAISHLTATNRGLTMNCTAIPAPITRF